MIKIEINKEGAQVRIEGVSITVYSEMGIVNKRFYEVLKEAQGELEWQMKKGEEMKVNEKIKVETKYMGEQEINEVALFTEAHKGSGTIWYKLEGRIGMNRYLIELFRDKTEAMKAHRAILQKLLAAQTKEAKVLLKK